MYYTDEDLAWASGIMDGEACIGAYGSKGRIQVRIEVDNIDPRMCVRLKDIFGGSVRIQSKAMPPKKRRYRWAVQDQVAGSVLRKVYPYLVIKQEQADVALAILNTYVGRGQRVSSEALRNRAELAKELKDLKHQNFKKYWTPGI